MNVKTRREFAEEYKPYNKVSNVPIDTNVKKVENRVDGPGGEASAI